MRHPAPIPERHKALNYPTSSSPRKKSQCVKACSSQQTHHLILISNLPSLQTFPTNYVRWLWVKQPTSKYRTWGWNGHPTGLVYLQGSFRMLTGELRFWPLPFSRITPNDLRRSLLFDAKRAIPWMAATSKTDVEELQGCFAVSSLQFALVWSAAENVLTRPLITSRFFGFAWIWIFKILCRISTAMQKAFTMSPHKAWFFKGCLLCTTGSNTCGRILEDRD